MKKLFALLIALMMVFSLVACDLGNTEDPNKDNPGTSQSGENNNGGETLEWPSEHSDIAWTGSGKILAMQEIVGTNQIDIYIDVATLDEVAAYIDGKPYDGEGEEPALAFDEDGKFNWQGLDVRISLYKEPQSRAVVKPNTYQLQISILG